VRDQRDGDHGEEHEADGEERYRPEVGAKLAWGGEEGRVVQQGRQEDEEDHPWGDLQGWQPWHEADGQAPKDEEDGVGNPEGSGQLRQQGRGAKQEDERLYGVHLNTAPLCTVSVPSVGANLFPKGWRHELQAILVLQSYLKVHLDGRSQLAREKVRHRL
jgi:hypothetical protein